MIKLKPSQVAAVESLKKALSLCAKEGVFLYQEDSRGFVEAYSGAKLFGGIDEDFCLDYNQEFEEWDESELEFESISLSNEVFSEDFAWCDDVYIIPDGYKVQYNVYKTEGDQKDLVSIKTPDLYTSYNTIKEVVDHFQRVYDQEEYESWMYSPDHIGSCLARLSPHAFSIVKRKDGSKFFLNVSVSLVSTEDS